MPVKRLYKKTVKRVVKKVSRVPRQLVTKQQLYKAINKNIETKSVTTRYGLTNFNSGINSTSDLITVVPPVANGTSEVQRIGSQITPIKLVIKGYIAYGCDTLDSASNIQAKILLGRLFLFQDKAIKQYGNVSNVSLSLLDHGGSPSYFDGFAVNWLDKTNTSQHTFFKDMKFKMLKPFGQLNTSTLANSIVSMDNSLFRPFTITLTKKHLPAKFNYDENSGGGTYPTNFAPYLALGYANAMNYAPDTSITQLRMMFDSTLYYKDA